MKLLAGDNVRHKTHGIGVVFKEWGMWPVCRRCLGELAKPGKCPYCSNVEDHPTLVTDRPTQNNLLIVSVPTEPLHARNGEAQEEHQTERPRECYSGTSCGSEQTSETAVAQEAHNDSSGTTQSRPYPARAVKRVVSVGPNDKDPRGPGFQSAASAAQPASFFDRLEQKVKYE